MATIEELDAHALLSDDKGSASLGGPTPLEPPVELVRTGDGLTDDEEDDEDLDETLAERLWGITEMFPEPLRQFTGKLVDFSVSSTKWLFQTGRVGLWVAASSATILALPVMFEQERAQMEEQQLLQQRQILLGPNAAVSGGASALGAMPAIVPPSQR